MTYTVTFADGRKVSTDDKGVAVRFAARVGGTVTAEMFGQVVVIG